MTARFNDARSLDRRLLVQGVLNCETALHLGGHDRFNLTDHPVLRDAEGNPFIPGATLAGVLRSLVESAAQDPSTGLLASAADALFGHAEAREDGPQSALIVDDARLLNHRGITTVRDSVRIDPETGVAQDKTKLDIELLPAGSQFRLSFELNLHEGNQDAVLAPFLYILGSLAEGGETVRIGAKTTRGLGVCRAVPDGDGCCWRVSDFRTGQPAGMLAWLARAADLTDTEGWPQVGEQSFPDTASLAGDLGCALPVRHVTAGFAVRVSLLIDGSLIVRAQNEQEFDSDAAHLHEIAVAANADVSDQPVLPGTSLAGVLRHRCQLIANTLAPRAPARAMALIEGMFGSSGRRGHRASRLIVPDVPIAGAQMLRHTRLRIDPWTGGALEGFLFTEDPVYGGRVEFQLTLRPPAGAADANVAQAQQALLLLALRDLAAGVVTVGGEGGVGRGKLCPPSGGEFAEIAANPAIQLRLAGDGSVTADPPGSLDGAFTALRTYLAGGPDK